MDTNLLELDPADEEAGKDSVGGHEENITEALVNELLTPAAELLRQAPSPRSGLLMLPESLGAVRAFELVVIILPARLVKLLPPIIAVVTHLLRNVELDYPRRTDGFCALTKGEPMTQGRAYCAPAIARLRTRLRCGNLTTVARNPFWTSCELLFIFFGGNLANRARAGLREAHR